MKTKSIQLCTLSAFALVSSLFGQDQGSQAKAAPNVEPQQKESKQGDLIQEALNKKLKELNLNLDDVEIRAVGKMVEIGPDGEKKVTDIEGLESADGIADAVNKALKSKLKGLDLDDASVNAVVKSKTVLIGPNGKVNNLDLEKGEDLSKAITKMIEESGFDTDAVPSLGSSFLSQEESTAKLNKELEGIKQEMAEHRKILKEILKKVGE